MNKYYMGEPPPILLRSTCQQPLVNNHVAFFPRRALPVSVYLWDYTFPQHTVDTLPSKS